MQSKDVLNVPGICKKIALIFTELGDTPEDLQGFWDFLLNWSARRVGVGSREKTFSPMSKVCKHTFAHLCTHSIILS